MRLRMRMRLRAYAGGARGRPVADVVKSMHDAIMRIDTIDA